MRLQAKIAAVFCPTCKGKGVVPSDQPDAKPTPCVTCKGTGLA